MPNVIPAIGATSLGIVIGWLVRYFIRRFDKFTPAVFGSLISILLGSAVMKFLSADKTIWWFYPIGLLIGFIVYQIIAMVEISRRRTPLTFPKSDPVLLNRRHGDKFSTGIRLD